MGIIRFILIGILAFILIRFLIRLISEVRSFLGQMPGSRPRPGTKTGKDSELRDIKDATFEDVKDEKENQRPEPQDSPENP